MESRLTEKRLREILRRQDPPSWGSNYVPAIKPSREEAPAKSSPAAVWSELLGRYVSTLSEPERSVLALILHCPKVFELQEQRMLPYLPSPHPLASHPLSAGMVLPSFRGTLQIAAERDVLHFHPILRAKAHNNGTQPGDIPTPWIGDFLVFLLDAEGPYCVNLSVKSTRAAFRRPQIGITPATNMKRAEEREVARHMVEEVLYCEVGIPTRFIAADELDPIVIANLRQLLLWQKRKTSLTTDQRVQIVAAFQNGMAMGRSALEVLHNIPVSRYPMYDAKIAMYQAIWHRKIRIDLFQYFFVDHPLVPEVRDVLNVIGHWFRRT